VFKAHRLCVSLNSRLESNKEEKKKRVTSYRTRATVSHVRVHTCHGRWAQGHVLAHTCHDCSTDYTTV